MNLALKLGVGLLLAPCCWAQQGPKPDNPRPKGDLEFKLEAGALAGAWTADTISTQELWGRCRGCFEAGGFFNGTRQTARIEGAWAAVDAGSLLLAYEWRRHIRNRWLKPFWRAPLLVRVGCHGAAAWSNSQLGRK